MRYHKIYEDSHFYIRISTNSKPVLTLADNFLDLAPPVARTKKGRRISLRLILNVGREETLKGGHVRIDQRTATVRARIPCFQERHKEYIAETYITQPIRSLLAGRGLFFLHAAAVRNKAYGVLIAGEQDCGKSTVSLALCRDGFYHLTDDKCFIRERRGDFSVVCLPTKIGFRTAMLKIFPSIKDMLIEGYRYGAKQRFSRADAISGSIHSEVRYKLLLFPRYSRKKSAALKPITKEDALYRLLSESFGVRDKRQTAQNFAALSMLVTYTDAYELTYNDLQLEKIPQALKAVTPDASGC